MFLIHVTKNTYLLGKNAELTGHCQKESQTFLILKFLAVKYSSACLFDFNSKSFWQSANMLKVNSIYKGTDRSLCILETKQRLHFHLQHTIFFYSVIGI